MEIQLFVICFLTFGIHLIGALAYSARIAGVRTRRIAISFALFKSSCSCRDCRTASSALSWPSGSRTRPLRERGFARGVVGGGGGRRDLIRYVPAWPRVVGNQLRHHSL